MKCNTALLSTCYQIALAENLNSNPQTQKGIGKNQVVHRFARDTFAGKIEHSIDSANIQAIRHKQDSQGQILALT